MAMKFGIGSLR